MWFEKIQKQIISTIKFRKIDKNYQFENPFFNGINKNFSI